MSNLLKDVLCAKRLRDSSECKFAFYTMPQPIIIQEGCCITPNLTIVGLDFIIPLRSKTIHRSEPSWLNDKLKNLIKRRQCALAKGNMDTFRTLRNCVNRERKICRAKYYEAKVSHLRECKPSVWWKEVKKLSGMSPASETCDGTSKLGFSPGDLPNYINSASSS